MSLSNLSRETFIQLLGGVYENSPWVAARAFDAGLTPAHDNIDLIRRHMQYVVAHASPEERFQLIKSQPDLMGKAALAGQLTRASALEHASAGLDNCSVEEFARFQELNKLYWARFGFPFVMAVQHSNRAEILSAFSDRLSNTSEEEHQIALVEISKKAKMRLEALLGDSSSVTDTQNSSKRLAVPGETSRAPNQRSVSALSDSSLSNSSLSNGSLSVTELQNRDPDYFPGLARGIPLGIQHVLAMFVSNITPAIIIAGAVGFGFGSPDPSDMIYMIQMSMLFAGLATLLQTITLGPIGAKLPIVQGTSFAFIPIMIPIAKVYGMAALMGGIVIGGIFHFFLGTIIGRIRRWLPPMVTGLVVLMIGLALVKVGIQYAAGGVPMIGKPEYGALIHWSLALVVIGVTLTLKFFTRGMLSVSAVLLGLIAGYLLALYLGMINYAGVERAAWFALPNPLHFGLEINTAAVIGMCLVSLVSAIETVGDISGITKGGAGREASDKEVAGGTMADGLGTAISGIFGALPNTSFSQNVGLVAMTGIMSRHVVTIGALFLIACGLVPKVGAAVQTMPISVLGGGVIVMFGLVAAAGVNMLSDVVWNRRNMVIFGIALSVGLGLQLEPGALQHLPQTLSVLMTSGLLPAAVIAIVLNLLIPDNEAVAAENTSSKAQATTPGPV